MIRPLPNVEARAGIRLWFAAAVCAVAAAACAAEASTGASILSAQTVRSATVPVVTSAEAWVELQGAKVKITLGSIPTGSSWSEGKLTLRIGEPARFASTPTVAATLDGKTLANAIASTSVSSSRSKIEFTFSSAVMPGTAIYLSDFVLYNLDAFAGGSSVVVNATPSGPTWTHELSWDSLVDFTSESRTLNLTTSGLGPTSVRWSPTAPFRCASYSSTHSACWSSYAPGTKVTLTAAPTSGYRFKEWQGSCSGTKSSVTLALNAPIDYCKAIFEEEAATATPTLTVGFLGDGKGSVSSSNPVLSCASDQSDPCTATVAVGQTVTLTAAARSGSRFAGWSGSCSGSAASATVTVTTTPSNSNCLAKFDAAVTPATGWWWSADEPGRGYGIEVRGNRAFLAAYMYRSDGTSVWYVAAGEIADGRMTAALAEYRNGMTLAGAWRAPTPAGSVVDVTVQFSSETEGSIAWGASVFGSAPPNSRISRFPIDGGTVEEPLVSSAPEAGWWWSPDESGTGYFIEIQGDSMMLAVYMYGADGTARWYAATGSVVSSSGVFGSSRSVAFSAPLYEYAGGQSLNSGVQTPHVAATPGAISVEFTSTTEARVTLPSGRQLSIRRFIDF